MYLNTFHLCTSRAYLGIMADDFFTFLAGIGVQAVVTGDAVRVVLHLDVFASAQGLVTVFAVEPVTHDVFLLAERIHRHSIHYQREAQKGGERQVRLVRQREKVEKREADSVWLYSLELKTNRRDKKW